MMRKFLFIWLFIVALSAQDLSPSPQLQVEQFTNTKFYSQHLHKDWHYSIYLPKNYYKNTEKTYPIVYLLHGMYNNYSTFNSKNFAKLFNEMIDNGQMPEAIFVCPDGFGYSWWINSETYGNVEDAMFKDLIPMVEQKYRVTNTRGQRVIAGISMGGYGALRYALLHPELFHTGILFSPAVFYPLPGEEVSYSGSHPTNWYYDFVVRETRGRGVFGKPFDPMYFLSLSYRRLFKHYKQMKKPVDFYVIYGSKDPVTDNATKNLIAFFRANRHPVEVMEIVGEHDWDTWKKGFQQVLNHSIFKEEPTSKKKSR